MYISFYLDIFVQKLFGLFRWNVNAIFVDFIDIIPLRIDITEAQKPVTSIWMEYEQRPFCFRTEFQKGHSFLESFQKIIICESAGIFVAQQRHKNPGFFFFKKGAYLSAPFSQPFSYNREDGFFVF